MQFTTIIVATLASIMAVAAAPQLVPAAAVPVANTAASGQKGSCSSGTAQCCATTQSGSQAKKTLALLGLNDVVQDIGLNCQQIPINVIGVSAAVQNQCKNTAVCCTGSSANGLIQTSCTPLSVN